MAVNSRRNEGPSAVVFSGTCGFLELPVVLDKNIRGYPYDFFSKFFSTRDNCLDCPSKTCLGMMNFYEKGAFLVKT